MSDLDSFVPNGDMDFLDQKYKKSDEELSRERVELERARENKPLRQSIEEIPGAKVLAMANDGSDISLLSIAGHNGHNAYFVKENGRLTRYRDENEVAMPRFQEILDPLIKESVNSAAPINTHVLNKKTTDLLRSPDIKANNNEEDEEGITNLPTPDFPPLPPEEWQQHLARLAKKHDQKRRRDVRNKAIDEGHWDWVFGDPDLTADEAVKILEKQNERLRREGEKIAKERKYQEKILRHEQLEQHLIEMAKQTGRWDLVSFIPELKVEDAVAILKRKNDNIYSTWGSSEDLKRQRQEELLTGEFGRISDPQITPEHILTVYNKKIS